MSLLRKVKSSAGLTDEKVKYERISYRQKGGESRGALFRGTTSCAFNKKNIGSIPSKYETILHPQNNFDRSGFGSNAFRFGYNYNENPGPGHYPGVHTSLKVDSKSFSEKGYGNGFVSKNQRCIIINYHPFQVPGPG